MEIELNDTQVLQLAKAVADIVLLRLNAPIKKDNEGPMDIKDVAKYIGRSVVSVRRLIRKDASFPVPIGKGKFAFDRKEIEVWWKNQKNKAEKIYRPR